MPNLKRSIWSVVAGILFTVIVTTLVDLLLHVAHVYPAMGVPMTQGLAVLATGYRIVISIAGAYLTAQLAPWRPMKHALILGAVGTVLGLAGLMATWNMGLGPRWYPVALALLALPQCWVGGKIWQAKHPSAAV